MFNDINDISDYSKLVSISDTDKTFLHELMAKLASVCDHALTEDGQGFNAPHSSLGHQLAAMPANTWDLECCNYAYSLAIFYQAQLEGFGYPVEEIKALATSYTQLDIAGGATKVKAKLAPAPSTYANLALVKPLVARQVKGQYVERAGKENVFKVFWDRKDKDFNTLYGLVKPFRGSSWDSTNNCWSIPANQHSYDLINKLVMDHQFELVDPVDSLLEAIEDGLLVHYSGYIKEIISGVAISFDYDPDKVSKIKSIFSNEHRCKWDGAKKLWTAPLGLVYKIVEAFPDFHCEPGLLHLADEQRKVVDSKTSSLDLSPAEIAACEAEKALVRARLGVTLADGRTPRDYQLDGAIFLLERGKAILAYDVGLGKTMTALLAAKEVGLPIIVVCPASVRTNWAREATSLGIHLYSETIVDDRQGIETTIGLATYSWNKFPDMDGLPAKFTAILDECHKTQAGSKTGFGKNALALGSKATNCYMLTGTPLPNGRPRETFTMLKIAGHSITNNKSYYEKRYCAAKETRWGWDNSGASNLDEWSRLVKTKLLVKKKEDCLSLPPLMRALITIDGDDNDKALYSAAVQALVKAYKEKILLGTIQPADALVLMGIVRRCSSMIKAKYAIEKCQEILDSNPNDKVLIFTDFIESVTTLTKAFSCDAIQGSVPTADRQGMVDKLFNTPARVLVTTRAGGEGLNIQATNHIIFVDRTFVPKDYVQVEGRAHRSGQAKTVFSYWLQYNDSDKHIDNVIVAKQKRIDLALEGERKTMRGIDSAGDIALEILHSLMKGLGVE